MRPQPPQALTSATISSHELSAPLAAIVESSDDAIVSTTLNGIITSWNPGAERLFGFSAAEAVGQHILLIIPEDRRAEDEVMQAALRRGEGVDHFETVRRSKHGRLLPVSLTISPVRDGDGHIVGASRVTRDITDRLRNEELKARLAAIVESSDDAIVSKTLDGTITSWNRGAERMFGYAAAEAVGQHIYLIIPEDRRAEEDDVLARLRRGERIDHFETVRVAKDGRRVSISLTVSPLSDSHGNVTGASKVARDITEQKQAKETLKQLNEVLEKRVQERTAELSKANDALRAEIAERNRLEDERLHLLKRLVLAEEDERRRIARELHDQLGQQLTALRLTLETLMTQAIEGSELRTQVEMLQQLALQLDDDVSFRVWELRPRVLEEVGLQAALTSYVSRWSERFGIPVRLHASHSTDGRLLPDLETTLYRLAQEALNNVAKHARADGVDVVLEQSSESVSLIVEDHGTGFDPSDLGGDGLGLVGMRERALLVGAEFQIESTRGKGTTVFVRVPVVDSGRKTA